MAFLYFYLFIGVSLLLLTFLFLKEFPDILNLSVILFIYPGIILISIIAFCFYSFIQLIDLLSRKKT